MKLTIITNLLASVLVTQCEGFIGGVLGKAHPLLSEFAQAQTGILFDVGLDIPKDLKDKMSSRLYIQGLTLELQTAQLLENHVALPGANGPYPTASTGPLSIETHSEGRFVSMSGTQTVKFDKGCWEMVWLKDRPAGSLVCGFELLEEVSRNDAALSAGGVYVSFPVFTKDTLEEFRAKKDAYESTFKKFTDEQADQLEKMNLTNNPLMKAVHFKNAIGANEKASMMRTNAYDKFPPAEEHIISIGKDLLLCTKGTVHTKSAEQKGKKDHTQVGEASLKKIDHSEV